MIFRIKHRWWLALIVTVLWAGGAWLLGGWTDLAGGPFPRHWQIAFGLSGGCVALAINGVLHELLKRAVGKPYIQQFQQYGLEVLDGMRWPEYVTGGLMAAVAEEPFFRGFVLRAFEQPAIGVAVAALVFAICHWLRMKYFWFWLWAMWEGILFGVLMVMTGSLLVPMIAHGLHDLAAYWLFQSLVREQTTSTPKNKAR
jgi:membrane protease YdiL (CAAX protease family)